MGRHEQSPHLVGGEGKLGEVVLILGDAVAGLDLPDVGRGHLDRDAHLAQRVLVPFEHALGRGGVLLLVGGHQRAYLLESQRAAGFQEQCDQVDQAFEGMHPGR